MKVFIAMDSFKGSLSSMQAGRAVADGIKRAISDAEVDICPIADGGEGTVEALVNGFNGSMHKVECVDPLGRMIIAQYGIIKQDVAVIEMCCAAGITLLSEDELNPMNTTTYGVGQVIIDAFNKGCRSFIIGIGGSATNDGGIGMLQALGFEILDQYGNQVPYGARGLKMIESINCDRVDSNLLKCSFNIACDVVNPLCGENGCSVVFGPQKGADENAIESMDKWLLRYSSIAKGGFLNANKDECGAGAAGGMGFAFRTFLNAKLVNGIELIINELNVEEVIKKADIIVTGEGCMDSQTVMGKAPVGIASIAKKYNKKVIAFAGCLKDNVNIFNEYGIDACFCILNGIYSHDEALDEKRAYNNMVNTVEQVFRLLK